MGVFFIMYLEVSEYSIFCGSYLYFDVNGTVLITRRFLQERLVPDERSAVGHEHIRLLVPGPDSIKLGNIRSYVCDWDRVRSGLLSNDLPYPGVDAFLKSLDLYLASGPERFDITTLRPMSQKNSDDSDLRLPVLVETDKIELPSFDGSSSIDIYSSNLNTYLHAVELYKSCLSDFSEKYNEAPDLPSDMSLAEMYSYCKELWHLWKSCYLRDHIALHLSEVPCASYEVPDTPNSSVSKSKLSDQIGIPVSPDVIDQACASGIDPVLSASIEREYNLLVSYLVEMTGQDYGIVKNTGYKTMNEREGIQVNNLAQKPVEMIRQHEWWDVAYKSLWSAYSAYLESK